MGCSRMIFNKKSKSLDNKGTYFFFSEGSIYFLKKNFKKNETRSILYVQIFITKCYQIYPN